MATHILSIESASFEDMVRAVRSGACPFSGSGEGSLKIMLATRYFILLLNECRGEKMLLRPEGELAPQAQMLIEDLLREDVQYSDADQHATTAQ